MSELRQNPATKEWVIIATERAKRPEDLGAGTVRIPPEERAHCPFCPGHEQYTPNEILAFRTFGTQPNTSGWWVRVIPNKFAALLPQGNLERIKLEDFFMYMDGVGEHEVIIESPEHDLSIATMEQKQVEEVFLAYRERFIKLSRDLRFEMVILFKNHGVAAGTSLRHPHSQIIATPITPMHIRHRLEEGMRFFDDNGKCVYCVMMEKEKLVKDRLVMETDNFTAFVPFASVSPFETWVLPKKHNSAFEGISPEHAKELAFIMRATLAKIFKSLNNPDFNYVIHSSPVHEKAIDYYHWHIQIIPRVSSMAGFELGSGIYINTVIPEAAAKFLRETTTD
ncbi:galactose-1-phosphate uridylyltransferase [Candidatus Saganbacteria bacterium]|uniref:Galactose-1-phosphate uridylyltransferase n=1 Tax=Candidatus Saganbacteria bacterium TaxID=2575572 RepID=A0A9D6UMZ1_UNCSA|nr:galactose-1-phosphate uridylyltransferase [Candidatus Saganbacteria bacterium]